MCAWVGFLFTIPQLSEPQKHWIYTKKCSVEDIIWFVVQSSVTGVV